MDIDQAHNPAPVRETTFQCAQCDWDGCLPLLCARDWLPEVRRLSSPFPTHSNTNHVPYHTGHKYGLYAVIRHASAFL
eukprot:COSAG05_NODE_344_length_11005_cov_35.313772_5_plen_78_part_00